MGAVDADGDGLREGGDSSRTLTEKFAVGDVLLIAAGEREPGGEFRMRSESLADGFGFRERRQRFEGEKVRGFSPSCVRQDLNPISMELDEIGEGAGVVAVVFGTIVECRSVRARAMRP